MKAIDIHGKDYIPVNERVKFFRENYDEEKSHIITTLISDENGQCVFKAEIYVEGKLTATGHAKEIEGDGNVNSGSYIENCETSAVGRALGMLGIGIDTSIASADEVKYKKPISNNFKEVFDDNIITFGKHKGKKWEDVPEDYLVWLSNQDGGKNPQSKEKALDELDRRKALYMQEMDQQVNVGEQNDIPF